MRRRANVVYNVAVALTENLCLILVTCCED